MKLGQNGITLVYPQIFIEANSLEFLIITNRYSCLQCSLHAFIAT